MLLERIENNLKIIEKNINKENFIYAFLEAYEQPKATINRLKKGDYNLSKNNNELIWKKKIFYHETSKEEDVHDVIDEISKSEEIKKNNIRFIIVTDFKIFLSIDVKTSETLDIEISELAKNSNFFLPLTGLEKAEVFSENLADIKAAEKMGKLYDSLLLENKDLLSNDRDRHGLNIFFTRILFCFFAEDSNIFEKNLFTKSIISNTVSDGSDLNQFLDKLFKILKTQDRKDTSSYLKPFPYVNGGLFNNDYKIPTLSKTCRKILIECGELDWNSINPDIFGSMMQAVVSQTDRKELGMHYTSLKNILKVIKPLFLDNLYNNFIQAENDKKKLNKLLLSIYDIRIFDPACGSGNFLVVTYKELYKLEIEILKRLSDIDQNDWLLVKSGIKLTQFYGIELDDYAHEMTKLSLWIAEHQMNVKFGEVFNNERPTLPLSPAGNVFCENATRCNWQKICPIENDKYTYLIGNPPYSGSSLQTEEQKNDLAFVFKDFKSFKNLDYIACWFYTAGKYIKGNNSKYSFVSTSSISQGEQVGLLWPNIFNLGLEIYYAFRPFEWTNHAKGKAGVTCVIIGIQNKKNNDKFLYDDKKNHFSKVKSINPYLIDADPSVTILRSNSQISKLPEMVMGNQPRDGGNFILDEKKYNELILKHPSTKKFLKKYIGSNELIKNTKRWCLWIKDEDLKEALEIDFIKEKIDNIRKIRSISKAPSTQQDAEIPHKFSQIQHEPCRALVVPKVTTSRRNYLPIDFVDNDTVISDLMFAIYNPENYLFGILSSTIHIVWLKTVSGRFRDGYRYSSTLCYNSFIFPTINSNQKKEIENCVFSILEQREKFSEKNLYELYNPDLMPESLKIAHNKLDLTVEKCYRNEIFKDDEDRLKFLFKLYSKEKKMDTLL